MKATFTDAEIIRKARRDRRVAKAENELKEIAMIDQTVTITITADEAKKGAKN